MSREFEGSKWFEGFFGGLFFLAICLICAGFGALFTLGFSHEIQEKIESQKAFEINRTIYKCKVIDQ